MPVSPPPGCRRRRRFVPVAPGRRLRGAIYARYSTRDQHSIHDQVRACREFAELNGIHVVDELVFSDQAVRGCRTRRPGLQALRDTLVRDEIDVLLVFTTNRLFRKTYKSLGFVEEEIVDRGKRCVFVKSGVDTADLDRWRQMLQMHAMIDEFVVQAGASHIRAAHEGLFEQELVHGTLAFGYCGEPISGRLTKRQRAVRRIVIDPAQAEWLRAIYRWYVEDGLAIAQIVRKLDREKVPLPPKCSTGSWTRQAVKLVLSNARYRGQWVYGDTTSQYLNRQDYVRQVRRDTPLKTKQIERLRIVDDVTWARAQERMFNEPRRGGRKPRDADRRRRPEFLNGMLVCKAHQRRMLVGGSHGRYYHCPVCQRLDQPALFSLLNRELAWKLVSERCASLLQQDAEIIDQVVASCTEHAERLQRPDAQEFSRLKAEEAAVTRRIQFILRNAGRAAEDKREDDEALAEARAERARTRAKIAGIEAAAAHPVQVPTAQDVHTLLAKFAAILQNTAHCDEQEDVDRARKIIECITGGVIAVEQMGDRKRQRGWLRGTFRCQVLQTATGQLMGLESASNDGGDVVIDFREPDRAEQMADQVKELYDQGLLMKEIAHRLACNRNLAWKALSIWHEHRGLPLPDGRTRRSTLERKHLEPPAYQRIAPEVLKLADEGLLLLEIAERLGVDRNTVTKSFRYVRQHAGEPAADGRSRRKALSRKTSHPYKRREAGSMDDVD